MNTVTACILVFLSVLACNGIQSAEILVVNPMPTYSHYLIPFKIAKELAERGHKLTHITAYPQKTKMANFVDIPVVENIEVFKEEKKNLMNVANIGPVKGIMTLFDIISTITNNTIRHKNVQNLLQSNQKFDLVLIEHFCTDVFIGFGHIFKAPVVLINAISTTALSNYIFANPSSPAYVPHVRGTLTKQMNFWQRIENLLISLLFGTMQQFYHMPIQRKLFKSYVKDIEFDDVIYNTSLMLTNSHPSFSNADPLVPNIIEVGGLHVTPKPIPKELEQFLDESKEGVILFSMGSNLRSQDLKPEIKKALLSVFSKLKQKILWKFEADLPDLPSNVKIMNWIPQEDVLAHPNIQVFITHGGRLSTIEALYHGVPIIGIPVFGDQMSNIGAGVLDGYAISLSLTNLTEEALSFALNEILNNSKYKENAKHRSNLMHDQPLKPMEKAIYWIEFVIRHKGAPHLKSAGLDLSWYQRELIDVIAFVISILGFVIFILLYCLVKIYKFVTPKREVISKNKKRQ